MLVTGKVYKDKKSSWWISEVPILEIVTQGYDKADAVDMAADAIESLVDQQDLVEVDSISRDTFFLRIKL